MGQVIDPVLDICKFSYSISTQETFSRRGTWTIDPKSSTAKAYSIYASWKAHFQIERNAKGWLNICSPDISLGSYFIVRGGLIHLQVLSPKNNINTEKIHDIFLSFKISFWVDYHTAKNSRIHTTDKWKHHNFVSNTSPSNLKIGFLFCTIFFNANINNHGFGVHILN